MKSLIAIMLVLTLGITLYGGKTAKHTERAIAKRLRNNIVMDGKLNDAAWIGSKGWQVLKPFRYKNKNFPLTKFKVVCDDEAIYFGIFCSEPFPDKIKRDTLKHERGIWQDDIVEIFIDPTNSKSDYYQFAINANGVYFDLYGAERGVIKDAKYHTAIDVKTNIGKKYWSIEAKIPYAVFNKTNYNEVSSKWNINLCRTRKAGIRGQLYSWAPVKNSFHEPENFGALQLPEKIDFRRFYFQLVSLTDRCKPGKGGLNVTLEPEIRNLSGRDAVLEYTISHIGTPSFSKKGKASIKLKKGESKKITIDGIKLKTPGLHDFVFQLNNQQTKGPVAIFRTKRQIQYEFCRLNITEPFYRNSIYPDEIVNKISGELIFTTKKLSGLDALITLKRDDKIIQKKQFKIKAPVQKFNFDAKNLTVGDYIVESEISRGKKLLAKHSTIIHKLPPFNGTITRIDKDLNLVINGKKVIAAGWYCQEYMMGANHGTDARLPRKINFSYGANIDKAVANGYLITVGLELRRMFKDINPRTDMKLPEKVKKKVREIVNKYKNHPGTGGYYLADEPGSRGDSVVLLKNLYEYVKSLDPYHVTYIIDVHPANYIACADVFGTQPYLTHMQNNKGKRWSRLPMSYIYDKVKECLKEGQERQAVWLVPECHSYKFIIKNAVQPNFDEERCELYTGLVAGARGFLPYTRHEAWESYDTRYAVHTFFDTMYNLETVITNNRKISINAVSKNSAVKTLSLKFKNKIYIIAVNTVPTAIKAEFTGAALKHVPILKLLRENRQITVNRRQGRFTDAFDKYEVHIYTNSTSVPYMATIREIKEEISWRQRHTRDSLIYNDRRVIVRTNDKRKGYNPLALHNGVIDHAVWIGRSRLPAGEKRWLEFSFPKMLTISRMAVYGNLVDYDVKYFSEDGKWKKLYSIKNNYLVKSGKTFLPVKTIKIKIIMLKSTGGAEINEVALYGNNKGRTK